MLVVARKKKKGNNGAKDTQLMVQRSFPRNQKRKEAGSRVMVIRRESKSSLMDMRKVRPSQPTTRNSAAVIKLLCP